MKKTLITLFAVFWSAYMFGQASSANGYRLQVVDTLKIFLVFAESVDDPLDTYYISPTDVWQRGFMPLDADDYLDYKFVDPASMHGYLTKYFYQASFGKFFVMGDYYPDLIQVDYSTMTGNGDQDILDQLNAVLGTDLFTQNNLSINSDAFDKVISPVGSGVAKVIMQDNKIDLMMSLWRVNNNITTANYGGSYSTLGSSATLKSKTGFMSTSRLVGNWGAALDLMRHEMSHGFFGDNTFHNGGSGNGARTFLCNVGGYAILSSDNKISSTFNAWDRRRLGWKYPGSTYSIKAINPATSTEIESDFDYNEAFPVGSNGEFILRDFVTYGDAIRIKLPYLQSDGTTVRDQWVWIENRQSIEGNIDIKPNSTKGIYAYIQVGKESMTTFTLGPNNYTIPLVRFGNWDFEFDNVNYTLNAVTGKENPLTGYHHLSLPAYDLDGNDVIDRGEVVLITDLKHNGLPLEDDKFNYLNYPVYGTDNDAFVEFDKLSVQSNPSLASVLSYQTTVNDNVDPTAPTPEDNRVVRLNGISIEVLDQEVDGDIRIKIRWDDYAVTQNVRWCGNLAMHDKLYPQSTAVITLDRGLSPTRPLDPLSFLAQDVFTDPTLLILRSGSQTIMSNTSKFKAINQSTLTVGDGANLTMNNTSNVELIDESFLIAEENSTTTLNTNSFIVIDDGSTMQIKENANVLLKNNTYILVKNGGKLIIEAGNNLELRNNAKIIVEDGGFFVFNGNDLFLNGTNTIVQLKANGTIETADNVDFTFTGAGYLYYYKDGIFDLGVNSNFVLQGSGDTDRKMWVGTDALLYIANHNVTVNDCRLDYNSGATFKMSESTVIFDNVFVNDGLGTAGHAIYAYNTDELTVNSSDFTGFNSTILLEDIDVCPNDVNVKIDYSTFVNHDFAAIEAYNVERIRFFTSTATGQSGVVAGLFLEDVDECLVDNSTITDYTLTSIDAGGIFCHRVAALIIDGSSIRDNTDGIEARATNVFVRNSAEIKDNENGIYMMSSHDGTTNPDMMYRLVVGDEGCGWIINNYNGVLAEDILLEIDQQIHANASGNPFDIHPNRFDGNTSKAFEICYDYYGVDDVSDPIPANHNYWTGGIAPSSGTYDIGFNPICSGIDLDGTVFYSTQPINCDCLDGDCDTENTEENIQLRLSETSCNYLINKNGGGRISIANQYRDGYLLFTAGDYNYAYQKFNWLKNRVAAEYTNGLPDGVCKQLYISSITLKELSDMLATVHCLYPFWIDDREAVIEGNYTTQFLVFPNPARTLITLGSLDGINARYKLFSLTGEQMSEGEILGSITLDIENYPKGVYFAVFTNIDGSIIETQKIILQ